MTPRPPSDRSRALATAPNPLKRGFPGVTFDGKSPCHDDHHLTSERDKKTRIGIARQPQRRTHHTPASPRTPRNWAAAVHQRTNCYKHQLPQ